MAGDRKGFTLPWGNGISPARIGAGVLLLDKNGTGCLDGHDADPMILWGGLQASQSGWA